MANQLGELEKKTLADKISIWLGVFLLLVFLAIFLGLPALVALAMVVGLRSRLAWGHWVLIGAVGCVAALPFCT